MKYDVIFTVGDGYELEFSMKELRADVLILDESGNYFNPQFTTLNRIEAEFRSDKICYLEDNLVILHQVNKTNIIASIRLLHEWKFYKRWLPITNDQLEKYFYPTGEWVIVSVQISENSA